MNRTGWAMVIAGGILAVVYLAALVPSSSGYGYSGHRSGFFWFSGGNSRVYHDSASVRGGSLGSRSGGGGTAGGK